MKHQISRVGIALIAIIVSSFSLQSQTFNNRYDPSDGFVPNPLWLPQNVVSLTENPNTGKILTVANYDDPTSMNPGNQNAIIQAVGGNGSATTHPERMHDYEHGNRQLVNSITTVHNLATADFVFAGGKQRNAFGVYYDMDMCAIKTTPAGSGSMYYNAGSTWTLIFGTNATEEEARLVIKDDPSSNTYLIVGVTDYLGMNNPYIARVQETSSTSASLLWAKVYPISPTDGAEPTSTFRDGNGDFYIVGEKGTNELFAFKINSSGSLLTNFITYSTEGTDRMPFIDQNSAGNTVISYTTGNSNATVVGLMNVSANLTTINWNKTYQEISSTYSHGVAVYHSTTSPEYVLATGHNQVSNGANGPGLLRTDLSGNPTAVLKYKTDLTYARTQSMMPYDDGYILKTLFHENDGQGLVKVDQNGYGTNTCVQEGEMLVASITTTVGMIVDDPFLFGSVLSGQFGLFIKRPGISYDCVNSTPIVFAPYQEDDEELEMSQNPQQVTETMPSAVEDEIDPQYFSVFPNPNNGQFVLKVQGDEPYTYRIISSTGKEIIFGNGTGDEQVFNLHAHDPGIYLLQLTQNNRQYTTKILVE